MTPNELQRMLEYYPFIPEDIKKKQEQLKEQVYNKQDILDTLKAAMMTGMPHGTDVSNPTEKVVEIANDIYLERILYIEDEIRQLFKKQERVERYLDKLNKTEKAIIEMRLFKNRPDTWFAVARKIHYSRARCFEIFNEALGKGENLNENSNN